MGMPSEIPDDLPLDVSALRQLRSEVIAVTIISVLIILIRLAVHIWPVRRLWWDDLTIAITVPVMLALCVTGVLSFEYGSGTSIRYQTEEQLIQNSMLKTVSVWLWFWVVSFTRMSIAFMVLRIKNTGWPRIALYAVIIFQFSFFLGHIFYDIGNCRPVRSLWDPHATGELCFSLRTAFDKILVFSIVHIVIDVGLSLVPIMFIRGMNRRRSEKILLCCLMGLGFLTSATALVKIIRASTLKHSDDPPFTENNWAFWSWLEMMIGTIAACAPFLKPPVENLLKKYHLIPKRWLQRDSNKRCWTQLRHSARLRGSRLDLEQSPPEMEEARTGSGQGELGGSNHRSSWGSGIPLLGRFKTHLSLRKRSTES